MREPQALTTSTETGRDAAQHWVTLGHWRIPVRLALRFFAEMKAMIGIVQADRRAPVDRVALGHLRSGPPDRGPGPDPRNWACWQTGTQGPPTLNPASPTSPPRGVRVQGHRRADLPRDARPGRLPTRPARPLTSLNHPHISQKSPQTGSSPMSVG